MQIILQDRNVHFDDDTLEWVVEFSTGEVARSKSRRAIEDLLDYVDALTNERI